MPWGYVPPFGTTSCLYEGPWHVHVPLGTYPQGTASFANVKVVASIAKTPQARRVAITVEPSSYPRSSVFRESSIRPESRVPRRAGARSKHCPQRAEGRRSAALGVERHMEVPRSRTEAGRRRERRPPVRQNGGPLRSRRNRTLLKKTTAPSGADGARERSWNRRQRAPRRPAELSPGGPPGSLP